MLTKIEPRANRQRGKKSKHDQKAGAKGFVDLFIEKRLLVADTDPQGGVTVSVAHEALLREWQRVKEWLIENRGVQPDVVVDNPPDLVLRGQDPQLEKAVEMLMEQIKANPKKLPARPPDLPTYPDGPGL